LVLTGRVDRPTGEAPHANWPSTSEPHTARAAELRKELARRGIVFAMARVKQDLRDILDRAGFPQRVGTDRIFPTLPTAVAAFRQWHKRNGHP
jgi:MFS superfamily sulfate permease-like transporter